MSCACFSSELPSPTLGAFFGVDGRAGQRNHDTVVYVDMLQHCSNRVEWCIDCNGTRRSLVHVDFEHRTEHWRGSRKQATMEVKLMSRRKHFDVWEQRCLPQDSCCVVFPLGLNALA